MRAICGLKALGVVLLGLTVLSLSGCASSQAQTPNTTAKKANQISCDHSGGSEPGIQVPTGENCAITKAIDGAIGESVAQYYEEQNHQQMIVDLMTDIECSNTEPLLVWLPDPQLKEMRENCKQGYLYDTESRRNVVLSLEKYANLGSMPAKYHLANFYLFGIEKPQSTETAMGMLQRLADQGSIDAHMALSRLYKSKNYGLFDLDKSEYHFGQAGLLMHLKWADLEQDARKY